MWQGHWARQDSSLQGQKRWQIYGSGLFPEELAVELCGVAESSPSPELPLHVILPGSQSSEPGGAASLG